MLSLTDIESFYPPSVRHASRFLLREYLQCKILEIIFSSQYANRLCFIGGTCLRLLHGNQRFSEDLDFDHFGMTETAFDDIVERLGHELELQGFKVELRQIQKGAWHCYLKFPDLLFQTGLSGHREEKILIQLDAEAQGFDFTPERRLLRQFDVFTNVMVPSLSLLLSHKITAILQRPRNKGRDFFDVTFLQPKTKPDYAFLKAKFGITGAESLKERLLNHCNTLDFNEMAQDVEPFLFNARDVNRVMFFPDFVKEAAW